jgi:hypothetical protein
MNKTNNKNIKNDKSKKSNKQKGGNYANPENFPTTLSPCYKNTPKLGWHAGGGNTCAVKEMPIDQLINIKTCDQMTPSEKAFFDRYQAVSAVGGAKKKTKTQTKKTISTSTKKKSSTKKKTTKK